MTSPTDPPDSDPPTADLVPDLIGPGNELAAANSATDRPATAALSELLAQQQRDASASRAQTRELTRALGELRTSQEFLGTSLREERSGKGWIVVGLLLTACAVGAFGWWARGELGGVEDNLSARIDELQDGEREQRLEMLKATHAERVATLTASLEEARRQADQSRSDLTGLQAKLTELEARLLRERDQFAARERDWAKRVARLERENGAIAGLRTQVDSLRDRAGAEAARADGLERELRALQRETLQNGGATAKLDPDRLDTASNGAASNGNAANGNVSVTDVGTALTPPRGVDGGVAPPKPGADKPLPETARPEKTAAEKRAETAALRKGATRDPKELKRIRDGLNELLKLSPGLPNYQITKIGGVSGRDLLDVRVEGKRDGSLDRAVEAPVARITVNAAENTVLINFKDGDLIRGRLRAPFYQGRYGLLLDADSAQWKSSGLTCLDLK